jgi:hypothetical protein
MAELLVELENRYYPFTNKGQPIFNGSIYVGDPDTDPELPSNQKQVNALQENGSSVVIAQPIRTGSGGVPDLNGSPVQLSTDGDYSIKVLDRNGNQIYYNPRRAASAVITIEDVTDRSGAVYDSVADMVADTTLDVGNVATTKGYYSSGDGGGAKYIIFANQAVDGRGDHLLSNNSVALIQIDGAANSAQFGAISGSDSTDSYSSLINHVRVSEANIVEAVPTWKSVTISRNNIDINIVNEAVRVVENPIPIANRGMFSADGKIGITISGHFDLKGEGSREIGAAGLVVNEYNTVAGRTGISGPANSAVFFLRCTDIKVRGSVKDTGESGYLFRNCGNVDIDVDAENCAGSGIEFSFPEVDGSTSPMPVRENYRAIARTRYINDLKLGAGNGIGVSFAGSAVNEVFRNIKTETYGFRNSREVHQEFNGGSRIEGFDHHLISRDALQGAVVTMGRNGSVRGDILNPGTSGAGAINTGYPSLYGYLGSTGSDNIDVDVQVISTNDDGFTVGSDGQISAGSPVFSSASANFPTSIVGKHFIVEGANPSGSPLEAYVVSRDSATQLTLDLEAQVTVSGATYGYGSGCRNPLLFNGVGTVDFDDCVVIGGVFSGLPGEPAASAVKFGAGAGESSAFGTKISPPELIAGATAPVGLEISAGFGGQLKEKSTITSGFVDAYKGFSTNAGATRCPINRKIVQDANPDSAADTFGSDLVFDPRRQSFDYFYAMSIEFDFNGSPVGTLTAELEAVFVDGGTNSISLLSTSDQTLDLTVGQIATLHRDNQKIVQLQFRAKNSNAGRSADRCRLSYLGIEST